MVGKITFNSLAMILVDIPAGQHANSMLAQHDICGIVL